MGNKFTLSDSSKKEETKTISVVVIETEQEKSRSDCDEGKDMDETLFLTLMKDWKYIKNGSDYVESPERVALAERIEEMAQMIPYEWATALYEKPERISQIHLQIKEVQKFCLSVKDMVFAFVDPHGCLCVYPGHPLVYYIILSYICNYLAPAEKKKVHLKLCFCEKDQARQDSVEFNNLKLIINFELFPPAAILGCLIPHFLNDPSLVESTIQTAARFQK